MKKGWAYPPDLRPLKGCGWFLDAVQYGREKAATMEVYLLSVKISSPMLYNAKGLTNLRFTQVSVQKKSPLLLRHYHKG